MVIITTRQWGGKSGGSSGSSGSGSSSSSGGGGSSTSSQQSKKTYRVNPFTQQTELTEEAYFKQQTQPKPDGRVWYSGGSSGSRFGAPAKKTTEDGKTVIEQTVIAPVKATTKVVSPTERRVAEVTRMEEEYLKNIYPYLRKQQRGIEKIFSVTDPESQQSRMVSSTELKEMIRGGFGAVDDSGFVPSGSYAGIKPTKDAKFVSVQDPLTGSELSYETLGKKTYGFVKTPAGVARVEVSKTQAKKLYDTQQKINEKNATISAVRSAVDTHPELIVPALGIRPYSLGFDLAMGGIVGTGHAILDTSKELKKQTISGKNIFDVSSPINIYKTYKKSKYKYDKILAPDTKASVETAIISSIYPEYAGTWTGDLGGWGIKKTTQTFPSLGRQYKIPFTDMTFVPARSLHAGVVHGVERVAVEKIIPSAFAKYPTWTSLGFTTQGAPTIYTETPKALAGDVISQKRLLGGVTMVLPLASVVGKRFIPKVEKFSFKTDKGAYDVKMYGYGKRPVLTKMTGKKIKTYNLGYPKKFVKTFGKDIYFDAGYTPFGKMESRFSLDIAGKKFKSLEVRKGELSIELGKSLLGLTGKGRKSPFDVRIRNIADSFSRNPIFERTKTLPKEAVQDVIAWGKKQKGTVYFGSWTAEQQLPSGALRRGRGIKKGEPVAGDIDINIGITTKEAIPKIKSLVETLQNRGVKARVAKGKPTLVEVMGKEGQWHHALDIKTTDMGVGEVGSKLTEGAYGITFHQSPVKIKGLKMMKISEFGVRKMSSSLGMTDTGFSPKPHRMKDIPDFLVTSYYLAPKWKQGKVSELISIYKKQGVLSEGFSVGSPSALKGVKIPVYTSAPAKTTSSYKVISKPLGSSMAYKFLPSPKPSTIIKVPSYSSRYISPRLVKKTSPYVSISPKPSISPRIYVSPKMKMTSPSISPYYKRVEYTYKTKKSSSSSYYKRSPNIPRSPPYTVTSPPPNKIKDKKNIYDFNGSDFIPKIKTKKPKTKLKKARKYQQSVAGIFFGKKEKGSLKKLTGKLWTGTEIRGILPTKSKKSKFL